MLMSCVVYNKGFELQVIDIESEIPLSNVNIYYQVTKIKPIYFIESEFVPVIQEKYTTDENGCIFLEKKRINLGFWEYIVYEDFFINVDTTKGDDIAEVISNIHVYFMGPEVLPMYRGIFFPNGEYKSIKVHIDMFDKGLIKMPQGNRFVSESIEYTVRKKPKRIIVGLTKIENESQHIIDD